MTSYDQRSEAERRVAAYVCENWVEQIIRDNYGFTLGGLTLADKLVERWNTMSTPNNVSINAAADAVRHWVTAAGLNNDDEFEYYLSTHRINA